MGIAWRLTTRYWCRVDYLRSAVKIAVALDFWVLNLARWAALFQVLHMLFRRAMRAGNSCTRWPAPRYLAYPIERALWRKPEIDVNDLSHCTIPRV